MLDDFVAPRDRGHQDQYAHFTHELDEDGAESASRALVRAVPLVYGALLGGLTDRLLPGLSAGLALSAVLDLSMAERSMLRVLARGPASTACPAIAAAARLLAAAIRRVGLVAPAGMERMRCGVAQS